VKLNIRELIELAKASGRQDDPAVRNALLRFMTAGTPKSERLAQLQEKQVSDFSEILKNDAIEEIISPFPFSNIPSPEELGHGQIQIGNVLERNELGFMLALPAVVFQQHVGIFGSTGTGKSYLTKFITSQLIEMGIPVWFFDEEDEYKDMALHFSPEKLLVLDYKEFKRNIFEVLPGEHPVETLNRVRDVFRSSLYMRDGSDNLNGEILSEEFLRRGIFEGLDNFLTLTDYNKRLAQMKFKVNSRNASYHETLTNRANNLLSYMGSTYDCVKGFDLKKLMGRSVVFRLRGMAEYSKEFFKNDLFMALRTLCDSHLSELRMVIVLDEGHVTFNKAKAQRSDLGEPIAFQMVRTLRKRGISLIISDQVPGEISTIVTANTGTKIVFRLISGSCIKSVGDGMSLTPEQRAFIPELPARVAIIQPANVPVPFLIKVPELHFESGITNAELAARLAAVESELSWVPKNRVYVLDKELRMEKEQRPEPASSRAPAAGKLDPAITKAAIDYLIDIAKRPFVAATKRDSGLGLSVWKGNDIRAELDRAGFVQAVKVNTGTRGGMVQLQEITEAGWDFLDELRVNVHRPRGRGGLEHKFWAWHACKWFEKQGYKAEIEKFLSGKNVDIGVEKDGCLLAVELLITGEAKEIVNIAKDIEAGYGEVILCCKSEKEIKSLRERVLAELGREMAAKVSYRLLSSFLA
jgi:hypothetical protein